MRSMSLRYRQYSEWHVVKTLKQRTFVQSEWCTRSVLHCQCVYGATFAKSVAGWLLSGCLADGIVICVSCDGSPFFTNSSRGTSRFCWLIIRQQEFSSVACFATFSVRLLRLVRLVVFWAQGGHAKAPRHSRTKKLIFSHKFEDPCS